MMDEFDDRADAADAVDAAGARRAPTVIDIGAEQRIPELLSEVYAGAPAPLRAKLLECLLRPVGPLALLAIGAGAFGRFMYRLRGDAGPISLDDAARVTADQVLELARYVQQCSPHVLLRIGSLIADSPLGVATLSGSALLFALSMWRRHRPEIGGKWAAG